MEAVVFANQVVLGHVGGTGLLKQARITANRTVIINVFFAISRSDATILLDLNGFSQFIVVGRRRPFSRHIVISRWLEMSRAFILFMDSNR